MKNEKGENKMKTYTGIDAIQRMKTNWMCVKDNLSAKWKFIDGKLMYQSLKFPDTPMSKSDLALNTLFDNEFVDYKEPLKYKVGDEVWVKAKVIQVDENTGHLPYYLDLGEDYKAWFEESEVKEIDE